MDNKSLDLNKKKQKKFRPGFKIGPNNLPDGTYRRKVIRIKKDLIYKAKLKKSYAKLKAREPIAPLASFISQDEQEPKEPASPQLHPDRQAMLDTSPEDAPLQNQEVCSQRQRRRPCKPDYFEKQRESADQKRRDAEIRQQNFIQREKEKKQKLEEREYFRQMMAKARSGGKNGQRKLGRESAVLLEKIKRTSKAS